MSDFKLDDSFIAQYETIEPPFGFNGLGKLVYMRTYSRIKEDGSNEQWYETIRRVVEGTYSIQKQWIIGHQLGWNEEQGQRSAKEMYERMFYMKFLPPGRGLWAMGSSIINEKSLFAALNNCAFVSTKDMEDATKPFCFLMDMSMLGVGVGFDLKGANSITIQQPLKGQQRWFVIPDTREGWVESLKMLLSAYFYGTQEPIFSYYAIRPAGLPIKNFGGTSSGHEPLETLHWQLKNILKNNIGNPLSETIITDIMNLIGKCVVSGNVRRCLPEDTIIHTECGLKKIQDINVGDLVYTSNGKTEVTELVDQGKQEVMLFKTQLGTFECTNKHKIAVMNSPDTYEWKMAKDLKINDRLVFVKNIIDGVETKLPDFKYEKPKHSTTCVDITIPDLDEDMSYLIGLFHGDGYVYVNKEQNGFNAYISIACDPDRPKIYEKVKQQFKRFGVNINITTTNGAMNIRVQSKQLALYFSKFKNPKKSINIPNFILNAKQNIRAAYLAGLFDADGCSLNRPTNLVISIYPEFLKQVQSLYASLGIPSKRKLHRKAKGNWKDLYQLNLVGEISILDFEELVSKYSLKYVNKSKTNRSQNDYGFPSNWVRHLKYKKLWSPNSKQMTIATYQKITNKKVKLIPINVELISSNTREVQTYDISVKDKQEFIVREGLLVHNTAEIVFGSPNSKEYLNLKNYEENPHRKEFGWTSNNSVFGKIGMNYHDIAERIKDNGEPGIIWLDNMQKYSRMDGIITNKDKRVKGANPCVEQSLESYELCCLVETFPMNHANLADYLRTLKYAYLYAKTVTLGPTHWQETNRVMLRNRRIGCSISGIAQFINNNGLDKFKTWITRGYDTIQNWDEIYSEWLVIPKSIKTTSVKPSGTISLLAGATPGLHYPESRFYIRRMRLDKKSNLIEPLKNAGYKMEPAFGDELSTLVVEVPVDAGKGIKTTDDITIWEQLNLAAFMQRYWSDNQVSCTVTFNPKTEGDQIESALNYFQYQLKGISMLPKHDIGAFPQMPYEKITEEEYNNMTAGLSKLNFSNVSEEMADVEKFCDGQSCIIN